MTKKFWKDPKFKALKTEWEEKLKRSGFIDIEDEKGRLRQNAGNSYRTTVLTTIEGKQSYYELLSQGYHRERCFRDAAEKIVMLLRSRGMKLKDICFGLESIKRRSHRDTVRKIIRQYEIRWRIKTKPVENKSKVTELGTVQTRAYKAKELPEQYVNFVRDRWLKTYKKCNKFMRLVDPASYYAAYPKYINSVLSRPNATVRLASLADDEDVLLGFSVSEGATLHYVNVPLDYRSQGIGRMLVPFVVERFSHLTETGMVLWTKKYPQAVFNPFM